MIETIPVAAFTLEPDGTINDLNVLAAKFIADSKENLIQTSFVGFIQKEQKESFQKFLSDTLNSSDTKKLEFNIKDRGGNYTYSLITARSFIEDQSGKKIISLVLIDLTFHKMQSELIKESQSRFENIANSAPVMIWIADVDGLFSFVNEVWSDFTGRSKGDELGLNWLKNVHPDDSIKLLDAYKHSFDAKESFVHEFRLMRKDKQYRWIMIVGTPRINSNNNFLGLIGTCTDISLQKESEEKVKKVNVELEQLNATKDKFFSIISHDLRSSLYGLTGLLAIVSDTEEEVDDESKQEIISEASVTANNVYRLMENLLGWAQVQTGQIPYKPQDFSLHSFIENIFNLYKQRIKSKKINFLNEADPDTRIFVDKKMTETILRNLISNAIKFTDAGGIIRISSESVDDQVIIKIADNGVGMKESQLENIFKIDSASTTKGTDQETGSGLGLILCSELVGRQKGTIRVESSVGKGTTFIIELPKSK